MKRVQLSLSARSAWTAQVFILPFYLGFWFFFLSPLLESLRMSFSKVAVSSGAGYTFSWVGLENYHVAFFKDGTFTTNLTKSFSDMAWKVPVVIVLSLFLAIIINQKFRGRVFVRAVFFLPVIFASGVALTMINQDNVASSAIAGNVVAAEGVTSMNSLNQLLTNAGFSSEIISLATKIANSLFSMVWRSGIQMIIFLAGLQSISPALYEASAIEGATSWENFWKITLPMLLPTILINLVYTIVDNFTDMSNSVMMQVTNLMAKSISKLGLASSFAWIYFLFIGIILAVIMLIFKLLDKYSS